MAQTPNVPPFVTEVVVGGIWIASAVKVLGYTWESVSRTWTQLPPPGSGGGTAVAAPKAVLKADKDIGVPNLAKSSSATGTASGIAASPIINPLQKQSTGLAQVIVNGGKKVVSVIGGLIP